MHAIIMKSCNIKPKKDNTFTVQFNLTRGQLMALYSALSERDTATTADVRKFMENAADEIGLELPYIPSINGCTYSKS